METVLPTCLLIGKQDDVSYNVGDINAIRATGMGNRYPSNSVIRVAKQLLVNWKTANGAWSSDYQLVIGLVINSRSIFHRSICWPIRFARCFGGRRIFELLGRGESNFKISRDWNSTTGRHFICREEEEGEEKFEFEFRFRREMSKEDGEGERERDLIR